MSPTFRLAQGVPGSSSALAVARTFGLPSTVIERAEGFLSREDVHFETVVKKLNDERAALEIARADAVRRAREAEELRAALEGELRAAREREQRHVSKEAEALLGAVRRAREELREAQAKIRAKKPDAASIKEAEKALDRVAAQVAVGGPLEPRALSGEREDARERVDAAALKKGAKVWVERLRAEAEILEILSGGASLRVQAGPMKLVVDAAEARLPASRRDEEARAKTRPEPGKRGGDPAGLEVAVQTSDNTCDLRGLRTDDALSMAVTFLDRSVNDNRRVCFLVHGHGTGALKEAVRRELGSSPYVRFFRAGMPGEGGDGVTIAWLS